jgi:hypothetical protein
MFDRLPSAGDGESRAVNPPKAMNGHAPESPGRNTGRDVARGPIGPRSTQALLTKGHSAVRAMKRPRVSDGEPWQTHELFPAPPWATRSLFEHVLPIALGRRVERAGVAAEPAAGLGHMSDVIGEYVEHVFASDIYRYPCEACLPEIAVADFLEASWPGPDVDWIITNPPFALSGAFLERALGRAWQGVAFLQRMQWLEGKGRYRDIYEPRPPALLAPFSERVAMCEGGWDPECSTATMYAWFVWVREDGRWPAPLTHGATLPTYLIPPGRKEALTRASDAALAARCVPGFVPPSRRRAKGAPSRSKERQHEGEERS